MTSHDSGRPLTRRLKILVYEPYGSKAYGAIRHLISVVRHIDKRKFDVLVVSPTEREYWGTIRAAGGRCIALPPPPALQLHGGQILASPNTITRNGGIGVRVRAALGIVRYAIPLASLIREERVDIIHCDSIRAVIMTWPSAILTRKPLLWYVNAQLNNPILDRLGYRTAGRVVFQCATVRDMKYPRLVKKHSGKIRIVRNGIDLDEMRENGKLTDTEKLRDGLGVRPDNINVFFLGTVNPRKGVHYLLEALSVVSEKFPNVRLYVVGDSDGVDYSEYQKTITSIIESEGLQDRVVFTGWRADAAQALSLADIYALSSVDEGVPKSIIEAMAMGIPVVATRVGGVAELVRHGETGYVVEARNPAAMAEAMASLCAEPELRKRFGERGRAIAWNEYAIRDHVASLEKIYQELVDERGL